MRNSNFDNSIFSHCSIDLNDIGLLNYQDKTNNPEIFKFGTGITEEIVVEAISKFLKDKKYSISDGYLGILNETLTNENILNEKLKLWKGSFVEMILTNMFLPNNVNNVNNCYLKESFKFNYFLNNFFIDFEVNDDDIHFIDPEFFFERLEKYSSFTKSCIIILVNISNLMGPDNYCYFLNHKRIKFKEIIIKGACKFFTYLPNSISIKNRKTLEPKNYFTFKKKNENIQLEYNNLKDLKKKFEDLESKAKIFNFYLELPYSSNNVELKKNEFLIDFTNLSNFITSDKMLLMLQDLINSVILKTKKYSILKNYFLLEEEKEIKDFFDKNSLINFSKNKTKNVSFFILNRKKKLDFQKIMDQIFNIKSLTNKIFFLDFDSIKNKDFNKIWMGYADIANKKFQIFK
jgi:hypothetical protein